MKSQYSYLCSCGHSGQNVFVALFSNESYCSACGQKVKVQAAASTSASKKGRPRTVNKKTIRSIRFDDDEWALIQTAAEKSGTDISKFIRNNLKSIATSVIDE